MSSNVRWLTLLLIAVPSVAVAHGHGHGRDRSAGYIDRFEIVSTYDAYGGVSFGNVGPYQVIVAVAHGKLDPRNRANAGIVDLDLAPRDEDGLVSYSTDVVILRPKSSANAKRVLFYDVVNRGNKVATGFSGSSGPGFPAGAQGNGLLMRLGYTIVWSGWQGNLPLTRQGDTKSIGVDFPVATNRNGSSITGQTRQEFIFDALDTSNAPGLAANGVATVTLTYAAATTDPSTVTFNWRQTWKTPQGMRFDGPSNPMPAGSWSFINNGTQVQFTPPAGSDLGSIFTFIYTAKDPKPNGIGFAGVRDLVTFLNHDAKDSQGDANPLADLEVALCTARHCDRHQNFDVRILEGVSQSGRFTRDFLWQGFNYDARGDDDDGGRAHAVFNGVMPIIPASRKTYTNFRWSQPFRWSKEHEDHFQPGDQFPFAYNVIRDPVSGRVDGILRQCGETGTCPKVIQLDGGFETFGGRGALVTTDGKGHDLELPDNVRLYLVPGANHGGGGGVAALSQSPLCRYLGSAVVESTFDRSLIPVLEDWVARGTPPPPSAYPSNRTRDLAPIENQAAVGFPNLSALGISYPANLSNELYVTDYSHAAPVVDLSKPYRILVSKTDSDGNELAGIRVPEVAVPLATYTSWNIRTTGHASGDGCFFQGATFPFAATKAQRLANGDPRPSLEERYSSKEDYVNKVRAAAEALVRQRLLLEEDVPVYVNAAQAQKLLQ
jgi:hypothetical protein